MPTYRLLLEYDGTHFAGWQILPKGRTVQGTLLEALRKVTGEQDLRLVGAGRTDAGVHALGQVASFRTLRPVGLPKALAQLEALCPGDLAVRRWALAAPGFHARHDATGRAYRYQIAFRRSAFAKRYSWWMPHKLDRAAMEEAGAQLVGLHDFATFTRRAKEQKSTKVSLEEITVYQEEDWLLLRFVGSHFLWNQVRRMVAILVEVGLGKIRPADVPHFLSGHKPLPPVSAPAAGLFLEAVRYPGEVFDLPPLLPVGIPLYSSAYRRSFP
ncbi:MAG: tRNA pseudouridine(38-40) synthase TruA [Thermoanaerobaculaceae bacterium]